MAKKVIKALVKIYSFVLMILLLAFIVFSIINMPIIYSKLNKVQEEQKELREMVLAMNGSVVQFNSSLEIYEQDLFEEKLKDGLVAHWSFDKGTVEGNIVKDLANDHDCTVHGATWKEEITDDGTDGYFEFDGIDDYIDCGNSSDFNFGTGDFTIQITFTSEYKAGASLISKGNYFNSGEGYSISYANNPKLLYFTLGSEDEKYSIGTKLHNVENKSILHIYRKEEVFEIIVNGVSGKKIQSSPEFNLKSESNILIGKSDVIGKSLKSQIYDIKIFEHGFDSSIFGK